MGVLEGVVKWVFWRGSKIGVWYIECRKLSVWYVVFSIIQQGRKRGGGERGEGGKGGGGERKKIERERERLRWGWVFLERTWILSGIQFTTHSIDFFVVETKRFVGSSVHVILTRQTCGQRSSRAAESKHRALGNYFSEWICEMLPISKCRRDQDLGLCTILVLAFGEPQRNDKIRFFLRRNTFFFWKSPLRCGSPNASPRVVYRPKS